MGIRGIWRDHLLPRAIDHVLGKPEASELRRRVTGELAGTVLEVGFGSGLNLPHLPPEVERVIAVDPARVGRELARERIAACGAEVEFVDAAADGTLPIPVGSVDRVLTTWTLCTLGDLEGALSEMRRVLAPGGKLVFLEHGRADDPRIARRQRWLTPIHRRLAGGCRLDVPIDERVRAAGFELERLERYLFEKVGRTAGQMYEGVARPRQGTAQRAASSSTTSSGSRPDVSAESSHRA